MSQESTRQARIGVGDCVSVVDGIGMLRRRVPSGTCGVVAGMAPAGEVEVHFVNGRVELVGGDRLRIHTAHSVR